MLIPLENLLAGRYSEASDMARGPAHPIPTPCIKRATISNTRLSTTIRTTNAMPIIPRAATYSHLRE